MRELLLFACLNLLFIFPGLAQGPGGYGGNHSGYGGGMQKLPLVGQVIDSLTGQPLEYATVALQSMRDSSIISGGITDADGKFELEIPSKGKFLLTINFIGYKTKAIKGVSVAEGLVRVDLGKIIIAPDDKVLNEVVVQGDRSQIQLQLDKRVYTVGKDMSNAGGTATDVLENVPSVEVDVDGNVSLRGSGNVRILIDGKPSGLTSTADALAMLQADQIERIEVITNPSARYDAEGEVGIINIVLKKDRKQGFNGTVNAHVGYPHNYGGGFNLNYRAEHFNIYTGYTVRYHRRPGSGYTYQENYTNDTTTYYRANSEHERGGLNNGVTLGTDFFWKDQNTLGFSGSYNGGTNHNTASISYLDLDPFGNTLEETTRDDKEDEERDNTEVNAYYERTFDRAEQKFSASARYTIRGDVESSIITQTGDGSELYQRVNTTEDSDNWIFQTDYVQPVFSKGKFETGAKAQLRTIDNRYKVEQQDSTGWEVFKDINDKFLYNENIYAGYVMLSQQYEHFTWQLGFRTEVSDITGNSMRDTADFHKTYADWFPSAHLSYKINENNTLQLSYSRRISRPRFWELLPFTGYTDSRNFRQGNPNINPEYTNSIEFGYLKYWDKGSLLTSVYYRHRTNVIERIRLVQSDGTVITYPINLAQQNNGGVEFTLNHNFFKWWSLSSGINVYYFIQNGSYDGQDLSSQSFAARVNITSKWNIPKDFTVQAKLRYHSPSRTTQGKRLSMTTLDLAISKEVLKGKGRLVLSGRDLFNTRKWRSLTDTPELYQESEYQWSSRSILLSFTYAFGQQKKGRQNGGDTNFDSGGDE